MSIHQLNNDIMKALDFGESNQKRIIERLDKLYQDHGRIQLNKWRNLTGQSKNCLLHELVQGNLIKVLQHALSNYSLDVNCHRAQDYFTPLQLAQKLKNQDMCQALLSAGAEERSVDASRSASEDREKLGNIAWVDLEFTSFENGKILECAIIITDKDLRELTRRNWVIHFDQTELDQLGDWHKKTFADKHEDGNGLLADVLKSKVTKEEVEEQLLDLLKEHCVEKKCPLAGSSVHIDKEVLKREMPKVHDYLHYRIIDVSSFQAIMRRWAPRMETKIMKILGREGQETVNHRAMDDIEWSIAFMKAFRPILLKEPYSRHHQSNSHKRSSSASPRQSFGASSIVNRNGNERSSLYADERWLLERLRQHRRIDFKQLRVPREQQQEFFENPHLREIWMNRDNLEFARGEFSFTNRILSSSGAHSSNVRLTSSKYSTLEYWGQRKLAVTEIEFLTLYGMDEPLTVIYVGAAPGIHIEYLSELFPQLNFILFDTKPIAVKESNKIKIRQEPLTHIIAYQLKKEHKRYLFICNVRTHDGATNSADSTADDMKNQAAWVELLKADQSLLYFRPAKDEKKFLYFTGQLIIEPWASKLTSECRLIVKKDATTKQYDVPSFIHDMSYFQNVTRLMHYKHNIDSARSEGLDHCYDCRAEIFILQQYLMKMKKAKSEIELNTLTVQMSHRISMEIDDPTREQVLGTTRTLNVYSLPN